MRIGARLVHKDRGEWPRFLFSISYFIYKCHLHLSERNVKQKNKSNLPHRLLYTMY